MPCDVRNCPSVFGGREWRVLHGIRLCLGTVVRVCRALFCFQSTSWLAIKLQTRPGEVWLYFNQEIVARKERFFRCIQLKALIRRDILIQIHFYSSSSQQNMTTKGKMVAISLPFHASPDPTPGDADVENQPKVRGVQTQSSKHSTNAVIGLALARSTSPWGRYLWDVFISMKASLTGFFGAREVYEASLVPQFWGAAQQCGLLLPRCRNIRWKGPSAGGWLHCCAE